jgi:hypothetical protein
VLWAIRSDQQLLWISLKLLRSPRNCFVKEPLSPALIPRGNLWITFALYSPILELMFPGPESSKRVVVQCKGCGENIPAPVETMPSQPIAARCPLCHEHRRYLPSEVFLGRLSHLMIRKPVRTADGRVE